MISFASLVAVVLRAPSGGLPPPPPPPPPPAFLTEEHPSDSNQAAPEAPKAIDRDNAVAILPPETPDELTTVAARITQVLRSALDGILPQRLVTRSELITLLGSWAETFDACPASPSRCALEIIANSGPRYVVSGVLRQHSGGFSLELRLIDTRQPRLLASAYSRFAGESDSFESGVRSAAISLANIDAARRRGESRAEELERSTKDIQNALWRHIESTAGINIEGNRCADPAHLGQTGPAIWLGDGGVIALGAPKGTSNSWGSKVTPKTGVVARVGSDNVLIWKKRFQAPGIKLVEPACLIAKPDGNVAVLLKAYPNPAWLYRKWVIELTPSGRVMWSQLLPLNEKGAGERSVVVNLRGELELRNVRRDNPISSFVQPWLTVLGRTGEVLVDRPIESRVRPDRFE